MKPVENVTERAVSKYSYGLVRYTFQGRRVDEETGLMYFRNRYYSVSQGRFITRDPLGYGGGGMGLYEAFAGNPINYSDPSGEFVQMLVGAALGAAIDYGMQVAGNAIQGKGLESFTDVNVKQILLSAGAGAITGGVSTITGSVARTTANSTTKAVAYATDLVVEAGVASAQTILEGGDFTLTDLALNMITTGIISGISHVNIAKKKSGDVIDDLKEVHPNPESLIFEYNDVQEMLGKGTYGVHVLDELGEGIAIDHALKKDIGWARQVGYHEVSHSLDPHAVILDEVRRDIFAAKTMVMKHKTMDIGFNVSHALEQFPKGYRHVGFLGTSTVGILTTIYAGDIAIQNSLRPCRN